MRTGYLTRPELSCPPPPLRQTMVTSRCLSLSVRCSLSRAMMTQVPSSTTASPPRTRCALRRSPGSSKKWRRRWRGPERAARRPRRACASWRSRSKTSGPPTARRFARSRPSSQSQAVGAALRAAAEGREARPRARIGGRHRPRQRAPRDPSQLPLRHRCALHVARSDRSTRMQRRDGRHQEGEDEMLHRMEQSCLSHTVSPTKNAAKRISAPNKINIYSSKFIINKV